MAKQTVDWDDFLADDERDEELETTEEEEVEREDEESEEEEEEEEEEKPKASKKKKKKTTIIEEEEEEEPKPDKKKVEKKEDKKAKTTKPVEEEEEEEQPKDEEEEKEEDDTSDSPEAFFEEVEKITGQTTKVDYQGVDPLSPQGVALREQALRQEAVDSMLTEIEEKYPEAFRALQHAYAGGDISELFKFNGSRDYTKVQIGDDDEALAKEILKEYYQKRGVKNAARLARMIDDDADSEAGLVGEAKNALQELANEQLEESDRVAKETLKRREEDNKRDRLLVTAIDEVIDSKKLNSFRIVDGKEANEFRKFVINNLRKVDGGKYELSLPIDQSDLATQLQYQYFQFKKGDLSKIIQQKAASLNAQKMRLGALRENSTAKRKSEQEERSFGGSMKDFEI